MKTALAVLAVSALAGSASAQIANGGFETGSLSSWTVSATNPTPVVDNLAANSGTFSALLGTTGGAEPLGDGSFFQGFVCPPSASLSFWFMKGTTDSITFDWQDAYVQDSSGTTLATIFHTCSTVSTWTNQTFDLSPYAGQSIRVAFLVHQDGFGDDTWMRVDDVSVTPAPGSLALLALGGLAAGRRRR